MRSFPATLYELGRLLQPPEGEQNLPPPNLPLWRIDYFELKLLKKQMVQGGHSDLLCSPDSRKSVSHGKGVLPAPGGRRRPRTGDGAVGARRRANSPGFVCTLWLPERFALSIPHKFVASFPNRCNSGSCGHFFVPRLLEVPMHTKLIFFSPFNLSSVNSIIRPAKEPRREKVFSPSPRRELKGRGQGRARPDHGHWPGGYRPAPSLGRPRPLARAVGPVVEGFLWARL